MYDDEVKTVIALIQQKAEFIELKLTEHIDEMKSFMKSFDNGKFVQKKSFDDHVTQYRWLIGVILAILTGVILKVLL